MIFGRSAAGHVIPPLPLDQLRQLYDLVLRLAPADGFPLGLVPSILLIVAGRTAGS